MPIEKAVNYFRGPEGYNCMQAVLKAFEEVDINPFAKAGHGGDTTGKCGALLAAQMLCPDAAEAIEDEFIDKAGSAKCREIRKANRLSCRECVRLAAQEVVRYKALLKE